MKFSSQVCRLQYRDKNDFLIGFSNDESAQIFNFKTKQTAKCSPGHGGFKAKNGMVNGDGTMVATTGTDGYLNLYDIIDEDGQMQTKFIQKIQISNDQKNVGNDMFDFSVEWLPSNEDLLVTGNTSLSIISKDEDGQWCLNTEDSVSH